MQLPLSASALALLGVGAVLAGVLILVVLAVRRRRPVGAARTPADRAALWGAGATPSAAPQPAAPPVPSIATPTARIPPAGAGDVGAARVSAEPVRGAPDPNAAAGSVPEPVSGSAGRAATDRPVEVSARVEPVGGSDSAEPAAAHAHAAPRRAGSSRTVAAAVAEAFAQRAADRAAASASWPHAGSVPAGAQSTYAPQAADEGDAGSPESTVPAQVQPLAAPEAPDLQAPPSPVRRSGRAADNDAPALGPDDGGGPDATVGSDTGGWAGASDRWQPVGVAQITEPATNGGRHHDAPEPMPEGLGQPGVSGVPPDGGVGEILEPRVGSEGDRRAGVPEPRSDRSGQALAWAPASDDDGRAAAPRPESGDAAPAPVVSGPDGGGPVDSVDTGPDGEGSAAGSGDAAPAPAVPGSNGDGPVESVGTGPDGGGRAYAAEQVTDGGGAPLDPEHPDTVAGNHVAQRVPSSPPDVRDRLLAVLLDDPERAVGATVELEACLRELGRLSDAVRKERAVLPDVLHRLTAAGLRPEQLARLAAMPVTEVERLLEAAPAEQQV
jgi:hypothetical protein